jgi:hypothetical protein
MKASKSSISARVGRFIYPGKYSGRSLAACFFLSLLGWVAGDTSAETLYVATGSGGNPGSLYTVDPATAAFSLVAPITNANGGGAIGVTGLAFDPVNGFLYGATGNNNFHGNTVFASLIVIDPATGVATVLGKFGTNISDISFRSDATLFGYQGSGSGPRSLFTINLSNGAATAVGANDLTNTSGGGLAFNLVNTALYLSATHDTGTLDTLNPSTGARTAGPTLTGSPIDAAAEGSLNALAIDAAGTLYAVDSDRNDPSTSRLVTVDTGTGAITDLGALPANTDGIAFQAVPEPATWAMLGLGGMLLVGSKRFRRKV